MIYFSSSDCVIRLNGVVVDKCYSLEVNANVGVMPYSGWADVWHELASGKRLASGNLILNVGHASYLQDLLSGTESKSENSAINKERVERMIATMLGKEQPIEDQARTEYLDVLVHLGRKYQEARKIEQPSAAGKTENRAFFDKEFNIEVLVNEGIRLTSTLVLEGCKFTGFGTAVQAGSSQNVKRAYSFIAKRFTA